MTIIGEVLVTEANQRKYDKAALTNAAVQGAIAMSFGKDRGRFKRYLDQFRPADDLSPIEITDGLGEAPAMDSAAFDDWSDF